MPTWVLLAARNGNSKTNSALNITMTFIVSARGVFYLKTACVGVLVAIVALADLVAIAAVARS